MPQDKRVRVAARVLLLSCSLAACAVIGGGPWVALQTFAWARMTVDYTVKTGSVGQGLAQTFDGEHPCELCRRIQAGAEKERHDERQRPAKEEGLGKIKLAAVLPVAAWRVRFPSEVVAAVVPAAFSEGRLLDAPPTPPPRGG